MPNLYVDAAVLACPCKPGQQAELDNYLSRIVKLADLSRMTYVRPMISTTAIDALMVVEAYPMWDNLGAVPYAERRDVLKIVYSLLDKLAKAEDVAGVREILVDAVECSPDDHLIARLAEFMDQHNRLLGLISLERGKRQGRSTAILLTLTTSKRVFELRAKGTVADIEFSDPTRIVATPFDFEETLMCCDGAAGVPLAVDSTGLWLEGADFGAAIGAAVAQLATEAGVVVAADTSWLVGTEFVASAHASGFSTTTTVQSLLRACADTILGLRLNKAHALRTGEGGGNPQVVRSDGARAMRRKIDDEYRLHYWVTDSGVELAAVGAHNSFAIPA